MYYNNSVTRYPKEFSTIGEGYALPIVGKRFKYTYQLISNKFNGIQASDISNRYNYFSVKNGYYNGPYLINYVKGIVRGDIISFNQLPPRIDDKLRRQLEIYSIGAYQSNIKYKFLITPSIAGNPSLKDGPSLKLSHKSIFLPYTASIKYWINGQEVQYQQYFDIVKRSKQEFNNKFSSVIGDAKISGILDIIGNYSQSYQQSVPELFVYLNDLKQHLNRNSVELNQLYITQIQSVIDEISS